MVEEVKICQNMLVPPSCAWHGRQRVSSSLTSRKLVLTVGPTLDLLSVHGMGDVVPVLRKERHIEDLCCLRYLPLHLMDRC